jgi:RNA-directed DNA polymerase
MFSKTYCPVLETLPMRSGPATAKSETPICRNTLTAYRTPSHWLWWPSALSMGGSQHLIKQRLKAPVIGEDNNGVKKTVGGGKANRQGTPQGGVISPLLANCRLHLDPIWQRRHLKGKLSAYLVRYADDFVVMCRKDTDQPLKVVRHVLERLDLSLNETKTHLVDATQASFNFLGFAIHMSRGAKTGNPYPNIRPADKSLKKIKARLTERTGRNRTPIPLSDVGGNVNHSLRGWANYCHYRNSSQAMSKIRQHAEDRLRPHLMKRHKVEDRGTGFRLFPSAHLYRRHGLYKVPTRASWTSAHALA